MPDFTFVLRDSTTVSLRRRTATIADLMAETLTAAGLWASLAEACVRHGVPAADLRILIKPDLDIFVPDATTGARPQRVELLIDLLHDRGYQQVFLADAEPNSSLWLENREPLLLADLVGYRFHTPDGHDYEVLNLSEELADGPFPESSILHGTPLSTHWRDAHFRLLYCQNKTDEAEGYALGLHNLLSILPPRAKLYHYEHRLRREEVALALYQSASVDFTFIDAVESNHGGQGTHFSLAHPSETLIASTNLLLADWVGALKMGLDPYCSVINAHCLRQIGLPERYRIDGDLSPYSGWRNVPIHLRESTRRRNESLLAHRLAEAWLQTVDTTVFPFKNVLDAQVNAVLTPLVNGPSPVQSLLVVVNYLLAGMAGALQSWQTLYGKDQLFRREAAIQTDLSRFGESDYAAIVDYILPLRQILQYTPPDANGLRWRYLDGSVLFLYERLLPIDYDSFVGRVDISQAVQMMYDNIGGSRLTVLSDEQGRPIHQAERDIYLPQPNWMVLFGGRPIDVEKIELIHYGEDEHAIYWRTVHSQNQSATYDDGLVSFTRAPGGVLISVTARQQFALPLFWQVVNMDYLPRVKDALVSDAYVRFFSRTMANFEAAHEGRDPRIGRRWQEDFGEGELAHLPAEVQQLQALLPLFSRLAERWLGRGNGNGGPAVNFLEEDERGFRHYNAPPADGHGTAPVQGFFSDLLEALRKDVLRE